MEKEKNKRQIKASALGGSFSCLFLPLCYYATSLLQGMKMVFFEKSFFPLAGEEKRKIDELRSTKKSPISGCGRDHQRFSFQSRGGKMSWNMFSCPGYYDKSGLLMSPEGTVEINPSDARNLGISSGNLVEITSRRGKVRAKAVITDRSSQGVVFMNFHFSESAVNILTNDALDPLAKIPELKVAAVRIEKV